MARPKKYPREVDERARCGWRLRASGRSRISRTIWGSIRRRCARRSARPRPIAACGRICRPAQEREEIRRLRQENYELRRANEILKSASVFFAKELDPDRPK